MPATKPACLYFFHMGSGDQVQAIHSTSQAQSFGLAEAVFLATQGFPAKLGTG